jgi:drug/metabolite transporter (DMT)-like permease
MAISVGNLTLLVVSIVLAIGIGDTVFFESTRRLGLGRGMTIAMSYPLVATALAAAFLGETITPRLAAGALLTLSGVALIALARAGDGAATDEWWIGVGGAVVAAISWGVSSALLKVPLGEVEPITAQAVRLPLAGLLLFATPWSRGAMRTLRGSGAGVVARMAVLSALTALSSVMFVGSLKHAGVAVSTVLSSTAPMFAIPLGVIFLGERLSLGPAVGTLVTVAGIVVLKW